MSTEICRTIRPEFAPCRIFPIQGLSPEETSYFRRNLGSSLVGTQQFRRNHLHGDLSLIGPRRLAFTVLRRDWEPAQLVHSFGLEAIEFGNEDLYQILLLDSDKHRGEVLARGGMCNFFVMTDFLGRWKVVCLRYQDQGLGKWCADSLGESDQDDLPKGSRLFYRLPEHF